VSTKTALITGATGGIGRALVDGFTGAGYAVIATDRVAKPELLDCQSYIQLDLGQFVGEEAYSSQVITTIKSMLPWSKLDVLVNNAAIQILGGIDSLSRDDWQTTLNVNLLAPFFLIQGLIQELQNGQGGVINIGSIHARLTKKNFVAYASSKAALAGMTRALAIDLGSRVRVNTIEPAAIETDMLQAGFIHDPERYLQLAECHPQHRIGQPSEVAQLALAIASDGMSFLNGTCVCLDGGISSKLFDPL